ncbi:MAG TPA: serine protease [Chitinophagaceae bacterium]|nr:serine protease [Chitinophagaceae bacterium]
MKLQFLLCGAIATFLLTASCSNQQNQDTDAKSDSTYTEHVEVSFFDLGIERDPLPLPDLDSLRRTPLTIEEYLNRKHEIEMQIYRLQHDTTLPITQKNIELSGLEKRRDRLEDHASVIIRSICGFSNNLVDIESFAGAAPFDPAFVQTRSPGVGLIRWNNNLKGFFRGANDNPGDVEGEHWGSGFLISDDLFVTAGHCFNINPGRFTTPIKNGLPIPADSMIKFMNVIFNYQYRAGTNAIRGDTISYGIEKLVEFKKDGLDYAIIRLRPTNGSLPGRHFSRLRAAPPQLAMANYDDLCIIQHANGKEKKVGCGRLLNFDDKTIYYNDIDTQFGSSGAPVIHHGSGTVIGVHAGGNCRETTGQNLAVSIQAIRRQSRYVQ